MRMIFRIFLPAALGWGATAAHAQDPADPAEIGAAVSACLGATSPDGVDPAALADAGWKPGELKSGDGKALAGPLNFYGKDGNPVLILHVTGKAGSDTTCLVMARIADVADLSTTANTLTQTYGAPIKQDEKAIYWRSGGSVLVFNPGGKKDDLALRIGVVAVKKDDK